MVLFPQAGFRLAQHKKKPKIPLKPASLFSLIHAINGGVNNILFKVAFAL